MTEDISRRKEQINANTSIEDFIEIVGWKKNRLRKGELDYHVYSRLRYLGRYIDTFNDFKELAEKEGGLYWLFRTIGHEGSIEMPYYVVSGFGEGRLNEINEIINKYGIDSIPWKTESYRPWGRTKRERNRKDTKS